MSTLNEQLFPVNFILNYIQDEDSYKRFLTYTCFRFLSACQSSRPDLPDILTGRFGLTFKEHDFSLIETFLAEDCYFSPAFSSGSYDPLFLVAAIRMVENPETAGTQMDPDYAQFMPEKLFHYAVVYELRNNLFDFHPEEDNLITLTNRKEKLRRHYVQYSNVYDSAMDAFLSSMLSRELLRIHFYLNIISLSTKRIICHETQKIT